MILAAISHLQIIMQWVLTLALLVFPIFQGLNFSPFLDLTLQPLYTIEIWYVKDICKIEIYKIHMLNPYSDLFNCDNLAKMIMLKILWNLLKKNLKIQDQCDKINTASKTAFDFHYHEDLHYSSLPFTPKTEFWWKSCNCLSMSFTANSPLFVRVTISKDFLID